jgi:cytochrome c oxidase assembly protein subunit 15
MTEERSTRIIANWIFLGVAMLIIQVLLGGVTRLTGSGLSITEWKPIMGALPPMNETEWQQAFEKYQHIAQYKFLNYNFTLHNFKMIFFWEWFHRLWARSISVVFLIPFIYFLVKKWFKPWMIAPLVILFFLGALQGAIGWIMVKSGLNDENLYVNHIRLAIHFVSAMVLICYALIFGLMLVVPEEERITYHSFRRFTLVIITLLTIQLFYGAFMAGLKGAIAAPTWPDINGAVIPVKIFSGNIVNDLFFNIINIHFIHRTLAYIIFGLIVAWWWKATRIKVSSSFTKTKRWPLVFVMTQVLLGILAVLYSPKIVLGHFGVFEWLAQLHQLTGMLLLLSLIAALYMLRSKNVAK